MLITEWPGQMRAEDSVRRLPNLLEGTSKVIADANHLTILVATPASKMRRDAANCRAKTLKTFLTTVATVCQQYFLFYYETIALRL